MRRNKVTSGIPGCLLTAREDAVQGGSPSRFSDTGDAQDEERTASTMNPAAAAGGGRDGASLRVLVTLQVIDYQGGFAAAEAGAAALAVTGPEAGDHLAEGA